MIENRHNFSRLIIHYGIFWFHVILLSSSVNGQRSTGSQQNQYGLYSSFDPTIALVIVVLFCAFFFVGLISLFIRQCSEQRIFANLPAAAAATAGNRLRRTGLDPAVIEKFPMFFYSEVKDIKIGRETLECVVCLSEFEDDETLRLLPKCNHVFHPPCIDKWLASHVTCPVCRAKVTQESGVIPKNSPQETTTESSQEDSAPSPSQISNEVVITIIEERNRDSTESGAAIVTNTSQTKNRPLRPNISGRFPRSHSTGHSLVQAGGNIARYTLKLPEEVRTRIIASTKLERTLSFNVTSTKEWSVKKGYRGSGGGEGSSRGKQIGWSDRWSMLINRPFVSGGGAVKCLKIDNELGDSDSVSGRNLLASVKLNCLNLKGDGVEEASTRARPFI